MTRIRMVESALFQLSRLCVLPKSCLGVGGDMLPGPGGCGRSGFMSKSFLLAFSAVTFRHMLCRRDALSVVACLFGVLLTDLAGC